MNDRSRNLSAAPLVGSATLVRGNTLDAGQLPSYAYGARSLMWWGTFGVIAIEGTVFVLMVLTYFYLRANADTWPPGVPPPDLRWGTISTIIMLASALPNHWAKKAAEREELGSLRLAMVVCIVFAIAFLASRAMEFTALNCRWDTNAYGSAVWMLLGLHTLHLITDFADTLVLAVLLFTGPLEGKRYVDAAENAMYWYFVVAAWLPIYVVLYWGARF